MNSWNETLHVSDSSSVHHQEFFYCTHSNGICHTGLLTACEQDQDILSWSCCQQTCMTYTTAVCTVRNSWWWTEELSETCRVSFPEQIWEISESSWFYYKKFYYKKVVTHLLRMNDTCTSKLWYEHIPNGRRNVGQTRKRWRDQHTWREKKPAWLIPCCCCRTFLAQ